MSSKIEITFNRICVKAAEKKASEIYLLPAQMPFLRIDGEMEVLSGESISSVSLINEIVSSLLTQKEKERLEKEKQIEIVRKVGKIGNSQIGIYFQKGDLALRVKLLSREIQELSSLGLPPVIRKLSQAQKGLVLITGPRDSGRSTLLLSLLNDINKTQHKFIATLEQPIKSFFTSNKSVIEQREVGRDVNSFLEGLAYIRQRNADIVMISRLQDAATFREVFAIAEAGSLVLAIMDTASSLKTIKRILHFFPSSEEENIRYFLSENLTGIISSRLVPRIGGGRIRAVEVLSATSAIRTIIANGRFHQLNGVLQTSEGKSAISMDQYLADLVSSGEVKPEDARKYCVDKELFQALLRR
jgi:twitching motility protein PilT